eukprot:138311-Chlamydomonas_euryale.AAC.2
MLYIPACATMLQTASSRCMNAFRRIVGQKHEEAHGSTLPHPAVSAVSAATPPMAETAAAQRACAGRKLSGPLAAAFNGALFTTLVDLGLGSEGQLQREIFRLRDREYPYYYDANKDRLPRIPDLSDLSGGMSNTTYFNFNYYILFKVAARRAQGAELRTRLNAMYGQQLLPRVWEGADAAAAAAAADGFSGRASQAAVLSLITTLLDVLLNQGYMCGYQVVWGEAPGTWPGDWMLSQARIAGEPADTATDARGLVFQVKIHEPADIKGSIALRAEEDGFWSRAVSSMVAVLLKQAGYGEAVADEYFFQDEWSGPTDFSSQLLMLLGDPLEMVDVPFVPTTLIQNYQL